MLLSHSRDASGRLEAKLNDRKHRLLHALRGLRGLCPSRFPSSPRPLPLRYFFCSHLRCPSSPLSSSPPDFSSCPPPAPLASPPCLAPRSSAYPWTTRQTSPRTLCATRSCPCDFRPPALLGLTACRRVCFPCFRFLQRRRMQETIGMNKPALLDLLEIASLVVCCAPCSLSSPLLLPTLR
eukprot:764324-Hanusia_phi.AAC.2